MEQLEIPGAERILYAVNKATGLTENMIVKRETPECYFASLTDKTGKPYDAEFRVRKDSMTTQTWSFFFDKEKAHRFGIVLCEQEIQVQRSRITRAQKTINIYEKRIALHKERLKDGTS